MQVYAYAIKSLQHNRIYVGQTTDLARRLKQHNIGITKATRFYRPWVLFYSKICSNRVEARSLEKYLKTGRGKSFLKDLSARSSIG